MGNVQIIDTVFLKLKLNEILNGELIFGLGLLPSYLIMLILLRVLVVIF